MAYVKHAMKDKDALFKGSQAKEYALFNRAVPHHDDFQRTVGRLVNSSIIRPAAAKGKKATLAEGGIGTGCTLSMVLDETGMLAGVERLYAVDVSPAMVDICRRDFAIPQIEFVTADLLSFFGGSAPTLDGAYSAYTIHNLPQVDQVPIFKAIYAKLKPGGCFVDGDLLAYQDPELQRSVFQWQQDMVRKNLPPELAEQWIDHYNQDALRYFTAEQLLSVLSGIGFTARVEYREKLEAVILARKP